MKYNEKTEKSEKEYPKHEAKESKAKEKKEHVAGKMKQEHKENQHIRRKESIYKNLYE